MTAPYRPDFFRPETGTATRFATFFLRNLLIFLTAVASLFAQTQNPRIRFKIEPDYAKAALDAMLEGDVEVKFIVDEKGDPRQIQVVRSLGMGLDEKAVEAVKKWVFFPATIDGRPVACEAKAEVHFRLNRPTVASLGSISKKNPSVVASESSAPRAVVANTHSPQTSAGEVLTNQAVIKLVKAGLRDDVIVGMINSQPGKYSVSANDVIAMKKSGASDDVIAAIVSKNSMSGEWPPQEARPSNSMNTVQSRTAIPTSANARRLTVLALSHSRTESDFTITTPATTDTNCNLYPNSVNCHSTSYGGGTEEKAVYRFVQIVTATEGGTAYQYTLSRTARWIWSSMDWLNDGESFPAEIRGNHMFVTFRRGGNQGKKETLKYEIVDIRPAQ